MLRHLMGSTDEFRQQMRDDILSTAAADFAAFADVLKQVKENGLITVLGSSEAITKANEARGGLLKVSKVM